MFKLPFWPKCTSLPSYSLLEAEPTRGLPPDLVQRECFEDYVAWRERIEADLFAESVGEDLPAFAVFLKQGEGLIRLQVPPPDGACLLVFSSGIRAADYVRAQIPREEVEYFVSSPKDAVKVIQHFREYAEITRLALDRCPRCDVFCCLEAQQMDSADRLIRAWTISKATELARCELYRNYARTAAREDKLLTARDIALELVGHVTPEDPRTHLLLGKLAIRLGDRELFREAHAFLAFLGQPGGQQELRQAEKTHDWQF